MSTPFGTFARLAALTLVVASGWERPVRAGDEDQPTAARPTPARLSFEDAVAQLQLHPRDPYRQYVALQIARREDRQSDVQRQFGWINARQGGPRDARQVGVFDLFSGSLAVQESLQLDRMLGGQGPDRPRPANVAPVAIKNLSGPTIKSHPWKQMLGDKQPDISPLARCVPDDFYFVEFRSIDKLLDLVDQGDIWGRHLFSQSDHDAQSHLVGDRIKRQLAIETSALARPFYDRVVVEMAMTGSDLFVREGSDVTLLFRHRSAEVFETQMQVYLTAAERANPGAKRSRGEYLGVAYDHLTTADRSVHVFAAAVQPDLHVRSNSLPGFQRVVAAIRGRDEHGEAVAALGDTTEFAYIRTLMPRGAVEEDGFVYLSDPFIRNLVGPQLRLTERRRMACYNHLRMIGHASLLYRTEHGSPPKSLAQLVEAKCAPDEFGRGDWACPDGGTYQLSADGMTGTCSHHGHAGSLTPCCEIPLEEVTPDEAELYRWFLEQYNQYWRTFFDPIAIRVQVTPKRYRAETIVLPLIDNSLYTGLARFTGGKAESLDSLPVPRRNIFSLAVHLDKRALAESLGLTELLVDTEPGPPATAIAMREAHEATRSLRMVGLGIHNFHEVHRQLPGHASYNAAGKPLLSWRVHILPFIEEQELYRQFHLDEPWDSPHNIKLVNRLPSVYRSHDQKLTAAGKTLIVVPVGPDSLFPSADRKLRFQDVRDGVSNTLMTCVADAAHAVVWTKPDDWEFANGKGFDKLRVFPDNLVLCGLADGSVSYFRRTIRAEVVTAMLTRAGQETFQLAADERRPAMLASDNRTFFWSDAEIKKLELGKLLSKGIGDQVGFHVYDSPQMFSLSLPALWGMVAGMAGGQGRVRDEQLMVGLVVSSINSPVYIALPVADRQVVDEFLERLDGYAAQQAREQARGNLFFSLKPDFYQATLSGGTVARSLGFQVGPVKWRLFWARIGDGLYIASKPDVLDDLEAIVLGGASSASPVAAEPSHGLVRLRPQHWRDVLSTYKLGWEENYRQACLNNLGPLGSVQRALAAERGKSVGSAEQLAERIFGVRHYCPDGGHYEFGADGRVTCSVHGRELAPRQKLAPEPKSRQGRAALDLEDVNVSLRFLEDGLHAVLTVDRKSAAGR